MVTETYTKNETHMTTHTTRETVVGVFHSHAEAQRAVRDLKEAGFTEKQIGIASRDQDGTFQEQTEETMAEEGAATGALAGLGTGALWGLGIAAGVLPAVGPVIAGGTLAAIAASAATTAAAGGLVGALIGLGIPEKEAEYYQGEFEAGRTLVTVKAGDDRYEEARQILDRSNSYDYDRRESEYASNAACEQRVNADGKMVAREELLDIDKDVEKTGEAHLRKEVHTDTARVEVPVKREELVVERHEVDGDAAPICDTNTEEERVVLREEEVDVDKRTVAKEEVEIGKRTVTDHEHVEAELKEEEIVVDSDVEASHRRS